MVKSPGHSQKTQHPHGSSHLALNPQHAHGADMHTGKIPIHIKQNNMQKTKTAGLWWSMPLITALGSQKQTDLCESEASLVYRVQGHSGLHREALPQKTKPNKRKKNQQKQTKMKTPLASQLQLPSKTSS